MTARRTRGDYQIARTAERPGSYVEARPFFNMVGLDSSRPVVRQPATAVPILVAAATRR